MRKASCVLGVLALVMSGLALAQANRGTVTGTVTDPQGAVVPAASVVLRSLDTGFETTVQTTGAGVFSITSVPDGTYSLAIEHPGFHKFTQSGITVAVAQTARIDVKLAVGTTTESITVTADASLLKTESAEQSAVVTPKQFTELPLVVSGSIRSPMQFIIMSPGIVNFGNDAAINFNGTAMGKWRMLLDGQEAQSQLNIGIVADIQPSVESLEEVALQTSGFAAEFGEVGAGLINMSTRSGTNQYHGTGYDIIINEAFNAGRPYSDDGAGHHVRPRARLHDFGFNIGGPVRIPKLYDGANRTFFFFNYEGFRQKNNDYQINSVPSEAFRAGDFSWLLTGRTLGTDGLGRPINEGVIYDPRTDRMVDGKIYRDPFPNNTIPVTMFDPVARKIQNLIPTPNISVPDGAPLDNLQGSREIIKTRKVPSIRIDHYVNSAVKLSGVFTSNRQSNDDWDGMPDPISNRRAFRTYAFTSRISYDHTLTPTLLNHIGFGHQHHFNGDSTPITDYDQLKELGLKGAQAPGFPKIEGMGIDTGNGAYDAWHMNKPTLTEGLTWVRGTHTFKFGGELGIDVVSNLNKRDAVGTYGFSSEQTGLPATDGMDLQGGTVGDGYASFLTGQVSYANIANPVSPQWRRTSWGLFAQDSWKVNRKLTLELGLRYDYQPAFHETHYRSSMWSPSVPNPSAGGLLGGISYQGWGQGRCNCEFMKPYPYAFGPRLGLAYRIDSKTVLRAGWGISYSKTAAANLALEGMEILGFGWNSIPFSTPEYGMAVSRLQDGLTYDASRLFATNFDPGLRPEPGQIGEPPEYLDRNGGRPPRMNSWSIGLQRELTKDLMVEAAYVGNRGVWWNANGLVNYNAIEPQRLQAFGLDISKEADRDLLNSRLDSPLAQERGFKAPYEGFPMEATVAQSLRPFPQFGDLGTRNAPLGNTWYDALQAKVTKRYSRGLLLNVAYTWSKNLGTVTGTMNDVANRKLAKTVMDLDVPHNFILSAVWDVPNFGLARRNALTRLAFGGWSLGTILSYRSGTPLPVPWAQNALDSLLFQGTPMDRVPGEPLFLQDFNCHSCWDPRKEFLLNPKAWADPAPGEWGTAARRYTDYRGARKADEQFQLTKAFQVREGMSLNVRFELFNAFNRMRWPAPSYDNPLAMQRRNSNGVPVGGFGYMSMSGVAGQRSGQLVVRFQF